MPSGFEFTVPRFDQSPNSGYSTKDNLFDLSANCNIFGSKFVGVSTSGILAIADGVASEEALSEPLIAADKGIF